MNADIEIILNLHQQWLAGDAAGARARIVEQDLSGSDFTAYNLSQAVIAYCNLTDCRFPANCTGANFVQCVGTGVDFSASDISDSTFEKIAVAGFNFIGATWNGQAVTANFDISIEGSYWCGVNNVFAQIGCTQKTYADWAAMSDADRFTLDGQQAVDWWALHQAELRELCTKYT